MERLRVAALERASFLVPCCRCAAGERQWDRIADKAYCPSCQESMIVGQAEPVVERCTNRRCLVCGRIGTLAYLTFPLNRPAPVEMDLCGEHLRCLLGRRLGPFAFHQLRRQLRSMKLATDDVFLLHSAFYDAEGRALRPALETD